MGHIERSKTLYKLGKLLKSQKILKKNFEMPDKIENESARVIKIDILTPPNEAILESDYNQNPFFRQK